MISAEEVLERFDVEIHDLWDTLLRYGVSEYCRGFFLRVDNLKYLKDHNIKEDGT
jgi:hypothetical protein